MTFVAPLAFVAPKAVPQFTTGRLVVHSDDGYPGDYTHWWPVFQAQHRRSQFIGKRLAPFCPAINSDSIGGNNRITWAMARTIQRGGGEILNHGRQHLGYRDYPLVAPAEAGGTALTISSGYGSRVFSAQNAGYGITHEIIEGATSEIVTITGDTDGVLSLSAPLANSYTTEAIIRLSEASMLANIQGCSDDAEAEGIAPLKHHVWTYHDLSGTAKARAATLVNSARGYGTPPQNLIDPAGEVDFYNLFSQTDDGLTEASIDDRFDALQAVDGVLIVYGHGGQTETAVGNLTYLIERAIERGIRIVTQSEAVAYLQASA